MSKLTDWSIWTQPGFTSLFPKSEWGRGGETLAEKEKNINNQYLYMGMAEAIALAEIKDVSVINISIYRRGLFYKIIC